MSRCPARARPRSGTRSPRAPRGGPRPRSTRRGRASPSAASTRAGYADHARGSAAPGHARRRPARPPRTAAPAASASPPYAHDTMRRETQLEGRTDALDLLAHFPAGVTPRPEQARLLAAVADAIAEALDDPAAARVVLVEGPPGVGKSHIAMTLARWSGDAYLLTSQKLLQDQYEREFGAELQIVKGRDNYACDRYPGAHVPTSRGACRRPRGPLCQCPYVRAKTAALGAPIFCANTAYFATLRHWHAERLRRRRLLIVDEAHNLEAQLAGVYTAGFRRPRCARGSAGRCRTWPPPTTTAPCSPSPRSCSCSPRRPSARRASWRSASASTRAVCAPSRAPPPSPSSSAPSCTVRWARSRARASPRSSPPSSRRSPRSSTTIATRRGSSTRPRTPPAPAWSAAWRRARRAPPPGSSRRCRPKRNRLSPTSS